MPRGAYTRISERDRARIVKAFEDGKDWLEVAFSLEIKRQTAQSIIKVFRQTGRTEKKARGGRHAVKMDDEMIQALVLYVEEKPTSTLEEMRLRLRTDFPSKPAVSVQTISRTLDNKLISLKILRSVPAQWNGEESLTARKEYAEWMMSQGIRHPCLIYLDEFGFNIWTARTQGRSPVGARAIRTVSGQRGRNVTLCLAMSPQHGYVHHKIFAGGLTKEIFAEILSEIDALLTEPFVLLFDNARPHISPPRMAENHEVRNLPKYSPFLNPAENAGSCVKAAVKRRLSEPSVQNELCSRIGNLTMHENRLRVLQREIEASMPAITQHKCLQWFNHSMSYMPKFFASEPIFD